MQQLNSKTSYEHFTSAVRVAVDACILPGTMMGTELVLLYFKQWRREYSTIFFGVISLLSSHVELTLSDFTNPSWKSTRDMIED
jgi:hypothetical protein